ncbi:MAG: phosphoribosylanthranilate isomerase [Bacteroidetes Order II. Incertae sedis bacterium]|nr:phosphoribosylanthranilate isomerase [Bacteroidetes Order II. bacterium]
MKLKICGLTNLPDARYCAAAGADFLGFIRYPKSPRFISENDAKEIVDWIGGSETVGVYVNTDPETINREVAKTGFTYVQLSGDETPEDCGQIQRPVIKGFRVSDDDTAQSLGRKMESYRGQVAFFLLDTHRAGEFGGTGAVFNWEIARELAKNFPLFLAGGLSYENAQNAAETVRPFGLDLSSRLEEKPGIKDFDKVDAFFNLWASIQDQER